MDFSQHLLDLLENLVPVKRLAWTLLYETMSFRYLARSSKRELAEIHLRHQHLGESREDVAEILREQVRDDER